MSEPMTHDELLKLIDRAAAEGWEELDLSGMGLEALPPEIGRLTELKRLVLGKVESWKWVDHKPLPMLVSNQLNTLPKEVGALKSLKELDLSGNPLEFIPEPVQELVQLESLKLVSIGLSAIPETISQLSNLKELFLSNNQTIVISDVIAQLTNLTTIDLSGNQIVAVPDAIGQLSELMLLNLRSNHITDVSDSIAQLSNLMTLVLSSNRITVIPETIFQISNLKELWLWNNEITDIPNEIAKLVNLTTLNLGGNQITSIPNAVTQLTNLQNLYLFTCQITAIPDSIAQLVNLINLDLSNNQITVIPEVIGQLSNLKGLWLAENKISIIPDVIAQLTSLTEINLRSNQIDIIPESVSQLSNLTKLVLGGNQITVISDSITRLSNLRELYLAGNQITVIPKAIGQLSSLATLWLGGNQIGIIPESITQLSNLRELSLWGNQITIIPESITKLSNLVTLDLWNNQITEIPLFIALLPKLEHLDLRSNPLSIPKDILDAGFSTRERNQYPAAKPILDYYFTTRDPDQTTYLCEAKLLIVGEGGAGKTSLAKKLLDSNYELTPETEDISTQGIDILKWDFQGTNGKTYCINLWDFGGQEIYHQTHQFFLTERSLYLLVADSRKEDTDHPYWLNIVRLLSNNSPVLLVQNEKQNRTCNLNLKELRAEFDALQIPKAINLADNRNLEDLRKTIQRNLEDLLGDGLPFPNKWLAVRHTLENDNRNYIYFTDYETTCRRHGIRDKSEMLDLSRFLHSLGICLHFQKDPILRQTLILKPNWGTAAVYKVLDNDRVKQNLGQFTNADLSDIWSNPQYANLHHELLQLMKEFKVCYEIPRRPGNYIAPHLLSNESPNYAWDSNNNLTLRYRYKGFMPKGILTRFIVEMHRQIENVSCPNEALVWKTGVVLTNGSARAEILENQTHREIQIRVSGNRPRDLLTVINHQFEDIHATFDDRLDYDTLIPCNCTVCKPNKTPFTFPLDRLYTCLDRGRYQIECHESGEDVQVRGLIDGVILDYPTESELLDYRDSPADYMRNFYRADYRKHNLKKPKQESPTVNVSVTVPVNNTNHNNNQQEQAMTESSKTNNFNGSMSGVIGSDNAQVSNNTFNQINNANTTELLQLIAKLRETATTFPAETQDAILIDLEDIETEVQKPEETRNPKKIRQRLTAILTAASVAASGVAGVTDFANTAIDLGTKLGIELQLPGAH